MKTFLISALVGLLVLGGIMGLMLYRNEVEKNKSLRAENLKTAQDAQKEIDKLKAEVKVAEDKGVEEAKKILDQITEATKERDEAVAQLGSLKDSLEKERDLSTAATDDMAVLRQELSKIRKDNLCDIKTLDDLFKKKMRSYETRILSLEAQLDKARTRLNTEAERYHYNLGVAYTQEKEFDAAVTEFKTALSYNPDNADAHYNLGIIYEDYFKDKENAKYHYERFLELRPTSDDAESVREWLQNLQR